MSGSSTSSRASRAASNASRICGAGENPERRAEASDGAGQASHPARPEADPVECPRIIRSRATRIASGWAGERHRPPVPRGKVHRYRHPLRHQLTRETNLHAPHIHHHRCPRADPTPTFAACMCKDAKGNATSQAAQKGVSSRSAPKLYAGPAEDNAEGSRRSRAVRIILETNTDDELVAAWQRTGANSVTRSPICGRPSLNAERWCPEDSPPSRAPDVSRPAGRAAR